MMIVTSAVNGLQRGRTIWSTSWFLESQPQPPQPKPWDTVKNSPHWDLPASLGVALDLNPVGVPTSPSPITATVLILDTRVLGIRSRKKLSSGPTFTLLQALESSAGLVQDTTHPPSVVIPLRVIEETQNQARRLPTVLQQAEATVERETQALSTPSLIASTSKAADIQWNSLTKAIHKRDNVKGLASALDEVKLWLERAEDGSCSGIGVASNDQAASVPGPLSEFRVHSSKLTTTLGFETRGSILSWSPPLFHLPALLSAQRTAAGTPS